jgi:hypothetical protein
MSPSDRYRGGKFAVVPEWVVVHPGLSDRAVRLYALIARRINTETGAATIRRRLLAETLGVSVDTVDRARTELVAVGALSTVERYHEGGNRAANEWLLVFDQPQICGYPQPQNSGDPGRTDAATLAADLRRQENETSLVDTSSFESAGTAVAALDEVSELCRYLAEKITTHRGDHYKPKWQLASWRKEMADLIEKGPPFVEPEPISPERVRAGIDFLFTVLATPEGPNHFCWAGLRIKRRVAADPFAEFRTVDENYAHAMGSR